jgi:hypothetical protein
MRYFHNHCIQGNRNPRAAKEALRVMRRSWIRRVRRQHRQGLSYGISKKTLFSTKGEGMFQSRHFYQSGLPGNILKK